MILCAWEEYRVDEDEKCRETYRILLQFPDLGYFTRIEAWRLLALLAKSTREEEQPIENARAIIEMLEKAQEIGDKSPSQVLARYRDQNKQIIEFRATMDFDDDSGEREQDDQAEEVDTYGQPSTDMGNPLYSVAEVHSSQSFRRDDPKEAYSLPAQRDAKTVQEELEQARELVKERRDLEQQAWSKRNGDDDDINEPMADDLVDLFR